MNRLFWSEIISLPNILTVFFNFLFEDGGMLKIEDTFPFPSVFIRYKSLSTPPAYRVLPVKIYPPSVVC